MHINNGEVISAKIVVREYENGIPRPEDSEYLFGLYQISIQEFSKNYDMLVKFLHSASLQVSR